MCDYAKGDFDSGVEVFLEFPKLSVERHRQFYEAFGKCLNVDVVYVRSYGEIGSLARCVLKKQLPYSCPDFVR